MKASGVVALLCICFVQSLSAASLVVTSFPKGMALNICQTSEAADGLAVSNVGNSSLNVSVARTGNFFTALPGFFTLQPGSTQTVTIRAIITGKGQTGFFNGSLAISASEEPGTTTVPVRLLVNDPCIGISTDPGIPPPIVTVIAREAQPSVEVDGGADERHVAFATFTNTGNGQLSGFAVTDADWLVPDPNPISIGPGETTQVAFTVDPRRRPDGQSPLGGLSTTASLLYLGGRSVPLPEITQQSVSVTIVDVVRPDVAPGEPPPLEPGEVATFLPGLSSRTGTSGNLFLAAGRGTDSISNLRLFYSAATPGSTSLVATISQTLRQSPLWFPAVLSGVFGGHEQVGTIQLRGAVPGAVLVHAVQDVTSVDGRIFHMALQPLRSDRGIGPGEMLLLPGVERTTALSTTLYLQEVSGNGATAETEFFDERGASLGARRTDALLPFRMLELIDVAPPTARSVRVRNTSAAGKIDVYGTVLDNLIGAGWVLSDSSQSTPNAETWIVPIISDPVGTEQVDLFVANRAPTPADVTMIRIAGETRRRRARSHSIADEESVSTTLTLKPLETARLPFNPTDAYLRITGLPGAISVTGRASISVPGQFGTFGTSMPAVPLGSSLGPGQGARFAGVDDSSSSSINARTAGTLSSSLVLIETSGESATARVTLRYGFQAGATVASQAISAKEFEVQGGEMLNIPQLSRAIIGPQRDAFGDLRNIQVDVEIISGSGRVIPFIKSVDNGSGSMLVLAE